MSDTTPVLDIDDTDLTEAMKPGSATTLADPWPALVRLIVTHGTAVSAALEAHAASLAGKADAATVDTALAAKADTATVTAALAAKTSPVDVQTYVQGALDAFVGAAPDVLDTWTELVAAVQADQTGLAALTALVGAKATPADITAAVGALAAVARTGAYTDLTGKPPIPTQASDIGAATPAQVTTAVAGEATRADGAYEPKGAAASAVAGEVTRANAAYATAADMTRTLAAAGFAGTYRGAWAGNTAYAVGDVTTAEAGLFTCTTAHTSNAAGFRYDREKWATVAVPVLAGATSVPVRQLDLTQPGASSANPPRAGIFQRRPKQFSYRAERVLWSLQAAADVTLSGTTMASATAGTALGGSVVLSLNNGTVDGYATAAARATPFDLTGGHLRVPLRLSAYSGRGVDLDLSSTGTTFTNFHRAPLVSGNVDTPPLGQWFVVSIPTSELVATGTGADLTAINGVRVKAYPGGGAFTVEVGRIAWHPNAADKAKVILWLDDGTFTSHRTAIATAAKYGLPVTLAPIADNLVNATAAITADDARYFQNTLGGQVAVHAFGPVDHNRQADNTAAFEQLLDYQHFGLAMGLHGVEDMAYWSSGYSGDSTLDRDLTVGKLMRSARGGKSRLPETLPPGNPRETRAMMTGAADTSAGTWQPYIQRAINCKGLVQLVWHDMTGTIPTEFAALCAWLDANRATVQVTTPQGAFDPLCV